MAVEGKALSSGECTCAAAEASCKTVFVLSLLAELIGGGHRVLVFSQSRVMLDILQAAIAQRGWAFLRIDGNVVSSAERAVSEARVDKSS